MNHVVRSPAWILSCGVALSILALSLCSCAPKFNDSGSAGGTVTYTTTSYTTTGEDLNSNACRDVGTDPISLLDEVTTYAGNGSTPDLPSTGSYSYREVPSILKDDDGYYDADAGCSSDCTPAKPVTKDEHSAFNDCGNSVTDSSLTSIALKIQDCGNKNSSNTLYTTDSDGNPMIQWNGKTNGINSEANWELVVHDGSNEEVWQDQMTGLLWSSAVAPESDGDNWCRAAGNDESTDPSGYCGSTTYQPNEPTSAQSECAEGTGLIAVTGWCNKSSYFTETLCRDNSGTWISNTEDYTTGIYSAAKGAMGANSANFKVQWRLPTRGDFEMADIDGIRMVMPDMGPFGENYDWSASVDSSIRAYAWIFYENLGYVNVNVRTYTGGVRCVGR